MTASVFAGALSIAASAVQSEQLIESFGPGAERRWGYVQDGVMGGVSQGRLAFEQDDTLTFARLTGSVSTDNNGGFMQFRAGISGGLPDWTRGIRLRVKGNGEGYYVFIRTTDRQRRWHSYRAEFPTTETWQNVDLALSDFKPSHPTLPNHLMPGKITGIGIVAYGRDFEADLSVAALHLLKEAPL
jgi:hypothetical protein